ncbi:GTP-binding protein Era [hydrothermal vent metagenome]|uniref:GTP-binding protein Era n=1 Tax=hydrothermal vent metagenome TaxID=652676 RepID=A0A3B1DD04_9ZZZZ
MVSIVGRPNVGKSTLLNTIVGEKIAIVSKIPQTTRNQIRGIYTEERGQIVFIDTPGIHLGRDKLDRFMNQVSSGTMQNTDCLIYVVDTSRRIGAEEQSAVEKLKALKVPIILALNKIDLKNPGVPEYIEFWEEAKGMPVTEMKDFAMVALSGRADTNVNKLLDVVFDFLPEGENLYPEDTVCDIPQKLAIADIIREKLFMHLKNELPHAVSVVIEEMRPIRGKTQLIKALILVERSTQKEIVIGKGGLALKRVGSLARYDLEDLLESKVYLECYVKVQKNWRDNPILLQELGYDSSVL